MGVQSAVSLVLRSPAAATAARRRRDQAAAGVRISARVPKAAECAGAISGGRLPAEPIAGRSVSARILFLRGEAGGGRGVSGGAAGGRDNSGGAGGNRRGDAH